MRQPRNVIWSLLSAVMLTGVAAAQQTVVVDADEIHIGNGSIIENGRIVIRDGRIQAVGRNIAMPEGTGVLHLRSRAVTPGLIDANALVEPVDILPGVQQGGPSQPLMQHLFAANHDEIMCMVCDDPATACALFAMHDDIEDGLNCPVCNFPDHPSQAVPFESGVRPTLTISEGSSEIVPHTHVLDGMNLRSPDFDRLVRGGVTTVFLSPDPAVVIGPRGAIVRTAGSLRERVIREADAVQATIGSDPFRYSIRNQTPNRFNVTVRTRRPNTRMGLAWVFRKAFYDTERFLEGKPVFGADTPSEEAMAILAQVRDGSIPFRIQARTQNDISSAIRLSNEFGLSFTLLEATDSYRNIDELKAHGVPVIFGPIYVDPSGPRARSVETRESRLATVLDLVNAGIDTALSAQDLREEDGLIRQAMYAVRAGLAPEQAIRMVTQIPARFLGLDDELGTIETGKRAELVLWSGSPLSATSAVEVVMINGQVVLDQRSESTRAAQATSTEMNTAAQETASTASSQEDSE